MKARGVEAPQKSVAILHTANSIKKANTHKRRSFPSRGSYVFFYNRDYGTIVIEDNCSCYKAHGKIQIVYTCEDFFMNFIFDIGNVLIDFKPEQFLHTLLKNPTDERKINEIIFESDEWIKLDEGTITPKQACSNFCEREPEYQELIIKVMDKLSEMFTPIQKTIELLPKIKKLGHKLYYLSNFHKELSLFIQNKFSFFGLFEGGVFSCDVHMVKPSAEIYHFILDKYKLEPKDCVFFDDTDVNVVVAEKIGIRGVLFKEANEIESFIKSIS